MSGKMVPVQRDSLRAMLRDGFVARGLSASDADYIAGDLIAAEAEGKHTHGVIKFHDVCAAIPRRMGIPTIVRNDGPMVLLDGQRELGHLVARRMVELAISRTTEYGIAAVGAGNFSYYGRIAQYVRAIADAGFVAIMLNSAGPAVVVPFGGRIPVLGTNPIAFAFPRIDRRPLAIDMATATEVWGQIALAKIGGQALPANAFTDDAGNFTSNPEEVVGVVPFGGAKGSALALAVEILGGALTSMPTGHRVSDEYDLGALLIAIDPARLCGGDHLAREAASLTVDIEQSADITGGPRAPGDNAQDAERNSTVAVLEPVWRSLREALDG